MMLTIDKEDSWFQIELNMVGDGGEDDKDNSAKGLLTPELRVEAAITEAKASRKNQKVI